MKTSKRLALAGVAAALLAAAGGAFAQAYPTRPVRTIMTIAGGADIVARLVAQGLTQALGQPVIVEAQAGAGGAVGVDMLVRSAPDGYNIMLSAASNVVGRQFLVKNTDYDAIRSFTPITKVADTVLVIITNPAEPFNSMKDVVEFAKKNPGKISYGTSGIGTNHHLSAEVIRLLTGIDWVHVPYKGGPPVVTDTMTDRIQVGFSILATVGPYMNSGKLKIIATANDKRLPARPDLPTIGETVKGYDISVWFGFAAPAGTPQAILDKVHDDVATVLKQQQFVDTFIKPQAFIAGDLSRQQFAAQIRAEHGKWAELVKISGAKEPQ